MNGPSKYYLPAMLAAAFWPVGSWYYGRLSRSPEELCGLFALLLAGLFIMKERKPPEPAAADAALYLHVSLLVLVYICSFHFIPPLARAAIAVTAANRFLSSIFLNRRFHLGLWLLLMLSLPVIPSLQFYLGYVLRVVVANIALLLVRLPGFAVVREGVCFNFAGQLVCVDAPCSGVRMLWAGLLLAAGYACFNRLRGLPAAGLVLLAVFITILANSVRAAALFFTEAGIFKAPGWFHEGIGVLVFIAAGIVIILMGDKVRQRSGAVCG